MKKKFLLLILILFVSFSYNVNTVNAGSSSKEKAAACSITVNKDGTYPSVGQVFTSYVIKGTKRVEEEKTVFMSASICEKSGSEGGRVLGKCSSSARYCYNGKNKEYLIKNCTTPAQVRFCYCTYTSNVNTEETTKDIEGTKEVKGNQYSVDGDPAYCLQPGKRFSESAKYSESSNFDVSECKTSNDSYECALAYILLATKEGGDYGTTLTALRIIAALKGQGTGSFGNEDEGSEVNDFIATTSFYSITGKAMSGGSYNPGCSPDKSNKGLICGGSMSSVYSLVSDTLSGKEVKIEDCGEPIIKAKILAPTTEVGYTSSSFTQDFTKDHIVKIIITPDGMEKIEVSSEDQEVVCGNNGKDACIIQTEKWQEIIQQICKKLEKKTTLKGTIQIEITNFDPKGQIVLLEPCGGDYQKMIVLKTDKEEKKENLEEPYQSEETEVTFTCDGECEEENECPAKEMVMKITYPECTDFTATAATSATHGITSGSKVDPYMNCILNTCAEDLKELYNQSKRFLSNNNKTCKIYCRETVKFWLPTKTTVYAGMQFRYRLNDYIGQIDTVSGKTKAKPMQTDQNLTSIVMTEVQCTSEIYYDKANPDTKESWLQRYTKANQEMIAAWKEFKYYEAMYKWELDHGKDAIVNKQKTKAEGYIPNVAVNGSCYGNSYISGCKNEATPSCPSLESQGKAAYTWGSQSYKVNTQLTGSITNKMKLNDMNKILAATKPIAGSPNKLDDGEGASNGASSPAYCEIEYEVINGKRTGRYEIYDESATCPTSSCIEAVPGDPNLAKDKAIKYRDEYIKQAKLIEDLIKELNECNLYNAKDVMNEVAQSIVVDGPLAKTEKIEVLGEPAVEKMLKLFNDEDGSITETELDVSYSDKYYGDTPEIEKYEAAVEKCECTKNVKYCVDSEGKEDCYEYIPNTEKEIDGSKETKNHKHLKCSGILNNANCKIEDKNLPINDYATFRTAAEADFWNAAEFNTKVFTGEVLKGEADGSSSTNLGKNVYPVSLNNYTDISDSDKNWIKFHFTNVGFFDHSKLAEYDYECAYKLINSTVLYDCVNVYDENGNISKVCPDNCLNVDDTVTNVCPEWEIAEDKKTTGFVYRNVDLSHLFPNSDNRVIGTNWTGEENEELVKYIETNADDIYNTTPEYSFTLSTDAIRKIREYNKEESFSDNNGGYLNLTLSGCEIDADENGVGGSFKNCKSSFLSEIYNDNNEFGVVTNKFRNFEGRWMQ